MNKTIGGIEFRLDKVNLRIRNAYLEMTEIMSDLSDVADQAQDKADEAVAQDTSGMSVMEKAAERMRHRKELRNLDMQRRQLTRELVRKRGEVLAMILEKNGYNYDEDFWNEEADVEDINDIVAGIFQREGTPNPRRPSRSTRTGSGRS